MLQRLNWEQFECLVLLVLKKPVAAQLPDVGELQHVVPAGMVSAMLSQVTTRQREMMTCFPKTASRASPVAFIFHFH